MSNRTTLTAAAALALALLASAPALAGCRSANPIDVRGNGGHVDTQAGDGAYWGIFGRGDEQEVTGTVAGPCSRAVSVSLGHGAHTRLDSHGIRAQILTQLGSGATARVFNRGSNDIILRGAKGSITDVQVVGDGTYVRSETFN